MSSATSFAAQPESSTIGPAAVAIHQDDFNDSMSPPVQGWLGAHHLDTAGMLHSDAGEAEIMEDGQTSAVGREVKQQGFVAAAISDSSFEQSGGTSYAEAQGSLSHTKQPAAFHTTSTARDLPQTGMSDAEAHATTQLGRLDADAAAGAQAGGADFILTETDNTGREQVVEKVYLATPQVVAGLAAAASGHSDADLQTSPLADLPARVEAFPAAAKTEAEPTAVAAASSPAQSGPHHSASSGSSAASPLATLGAAVNVGLAGRQDGKVAGGSIEPSRTSLEQSVSSCQTLPLADHAGSHSTALPLTAGTGIPSTRLY